MNTRTKKPVKYKFQVATRKFCKFVKGLKSDTDLFRQMSSYPINHTMRRAYVRAVFSLVDGIISIIKKELLTEYDIGNDNTVTKRELHILKSKIRVQNKVGIVTERRFFAPLAENVKVTITLFAYFSLVEHYLDEDSRGWKGFIEAINIRNRITHPKSAEALVISDQDLRIVDAAQAWFIRNIALIYQKIGAALLAQGKALSGAHLFDRDQEGRGYRINLGESESAQLDFFGSVS